MDYLYRANDGTIFDSEDECINYETLKKYGDKFNDVILWDEHNKKIPVNDIIKAKLGLEEVWAVYFPNDEIAITFVKAIHDIFEEDFFCYDIDIAKKGLYFYDKNKDSWIRTEDVLETISKKMIKLGFTFDYTFGSY